ncbi:MAG: hypothetical protein M1546_15085 [Chloroflexi bacterium]|nr:hypothetical protein [Chloroflexota bacterium]
MAAQHKDGASIAELLDQANAYFAGDGVIPRDYRKALQIYKQVARLGDPRAHYSLAVMYANGMGVAQALDTAVEHYRAAAAGGIYGSWVDLATLFFAQGQFDNAFLCWKDYFECEPANQPDIDNRQLYLHHCIQAQHPVEHWDSIWPYRGPILKAEAQLLNSMRERGLDSSAITSAERRMAVMRSLWQQDEEASRSKSLPAFPGDIKRVVR